MTMKQSLQWLRGRRASVTVLAAVIFPALVGMAGLATEYGNALLTKVKAQRIADAAAYGAAWAYNPANSSDANTSAMNAAANRIALLNGIATTAMAVSIGTSPSGDGNQAVRATVTMGVAIDLTKLINGGSQLSVTANSYVELKNDTLACIIAVKGAGTGVTLSGAGRITANACGVASAATTTSPASIVAPNGTTVTTPQVTTPQALTSAQKANIQPPAGTGAVTYKVKPVTDPAGRKLRGDDGGQSSEHRRGIDQPQRADAIERHRTGRRPTLVPPRPRTSADALKPNPLPGAAYGRCHAAARVRSTSIISTCRGPRPSHLTVDNASATYNVSGKINTGGATVTFNGAGTYNIAAGLNVGGGSTTTFTGAGTFKIGPNAAGSCNGANYSICNTGAR